ncbi:hypothetical protein PENTCL1PPCAC_24911, partial [Pristionchus entomophagus]
SQKTHSSLNPFRNKNRAKDASRSRFATVFSMVFTLRIVILQCVVPPVVFVASIVPFLLEHSDGFNDPLVEAIINIVRSKNVRLSS